MTLSAVGNDDRMLRSNFFFANAWGAGTLWIATCPPPSPRDSSCIKCLVFARGGCSRLELTRTLQYDQTCRRGVCLSYNVIKRDGGAFIWVIISSNNISAGGAFSWLRIWSNMQEGGVYLSDNMLKQHEGRVFINSYVLQWKLDLTNYHGTEECVR